MFPSMIRTFPLALAALLASCEIEDWGGARFTEDFRHTYPMKAGARLTVDNFNGPVQITGWDRSEIEITGTKHASRKETLELLKIEIINSGDSIQVRSVRPSELRRGNMGVKYQIRLPRAAVVDRVQSSNGPIHAESLAGAGRLRTSNGPVRLTRISGDADVETSNGPVELEEFSGAATIRTSNGPIRASRIKGFMDARTSNGPVSAEIESLDPVRAVKLRSSNGPITLTLLGNANARIRAHTSNSSITTDFPLAEVQSQSKTNLNATIGFGGAELDLATSNGPIRIQRR